jgi:hypothetical protein
MPDITITIGTPVLTGADYFKTRYRLVGGAYGANTNRTNAPFTLVGLAAGKYELEVILVKDGVECTAKVTPFTVIPEFLCQVFTPVIVQNGALFNLQISYGAITTPPCGWQVKLTGQSNNAIINYASFPASPLLIPVANEATQVQVLANLCNDKVKECLNTDVPSITPACVPMVITGSSLTFNNIYPNGAYGFTLTITYSSQSTPPSTAITWVANQQNVNPPYAPGGFSFPNYSYSLPISGGAFANSFIADQHVVGSIIEVDWIVIDACGTKHEGTATYVL